MKTQLRVRTEYSFKEAFGPVPKVVERLKAIGCSAAAAVDIGGGTWSHVQWEKGLAASGIHSMFGAEFVCVPDFETDHIFKPIVWVLAEDISKFYNLTTLAHHQKIRGKPALTVEQFAEAEGVIKFAGGALDVVPLASDIFIDVNPSSLLVTRRALSLAAKLKRKFVITSDNYYPAAADVNAFQMVGRQLKPTPQHLLTEEEAVALFGVNEFKVSQRATESIAERLSGTHLRKAPMIRAVGDLRALCEDGRASRDITAWDATYDARLKRELALIKDKDYESYFLVVADMVAWAKARMLVGPARGSAAGSLVCYLLGITEVDPIPYGLIFERFVDVTRKDLPDIDLDFPDAKRDLLYGYLAEKYGKEYVARIGTISSFKPRSALIEASKRLGIPAYETYAVKNAMFTRLSGDSRANDCLLDTLNDTQPGKELMERHPSLKIAALLEGHASHTGMHAAGVCVCNEPVRNFCTINDNGVMQLDKYDAEILNLLKIDVLGLRTLGVLEDTGVVTPERMYALKFDDPLVWKILNDGKYSGIFQWEGHALQSVTNQLTITSFADLEQITALARPGPLGGGSAARYIERHEGRETWTYPHPSMAEYLDESFGLVLYQEQVLRMMRELGDMSWDDATLLRKAMSKNYGKEYFDTFGNRFVKGATGHGIKPKDAQAIWDQINSFGMWAFNKAHSVSYAIVSYWTAWVKANYPLEYTAAALRNAKDRTAVVEMLRELCREGINYAAFDKDLSEVNWSVKEGKVIGGFLNLKGVGPAKAAALLERRNLNALTKKDLEFLDKAEVEFKELWPVHALYDDIYKNPEKFGIAVGTEVLEIRNFPESGEVVFIGLVVEKDRRDDNEPVRVARRNGRRVSGNSLFADIRVVDDSVSTPIMLRVDRFNWEPTGRLIMERVSEGKDYLLIRGKKVPGYPMVKMTRVRCLSNPELFKNA